MNLPKRSVRPRFQRLADEANNYIKARNSIKLAALLFALKGEEVKKLEENYWHRWSKGLKLNKYLMRDHIQKYLSEPAHKPTADKIIKFLQKQNPRPEPLTPRQIANAILSGSQRQVAIRVAHSKGGLHRHIRLADLAEWMFSDKNWTVLCDPRLNNPKYRSERGGGGNMAWRSFFRKPKDTELSSWATKGALDYLHSTAEVVCLHITWFYRDIGWLKYPSGALLQGAGSYLSGLRPKILNYRKAWHTLASETEKANMLKTKIVTGSDGPVKLLWGPISELEKLRGWKLAK